MYHGSCHCGAFKFSLMVPEIKSVMECNCSLCLKAGYKWVFPEKHPYLFESGEETLKTYEFANKIITFKFCGVCGTGVYARKHDATVNYGTGFNVRAIHGVDVSTLSIRKYDGKKNPPEYTPAPYLGSAPDPESHCRKIYTGSCHCGAVTMALKTQELSKVMTEHGTKCECLLCRHTKNGLWPNIDLYNQATDCAAKNGMVLKYTRDQVHIMNSDKLTPYSLAAGWLWNEFCGTCGVSIDIREDPGSEWTENTEPLVVNLRCFEGLEWEDVHRAKADAESQKVFVGPPGTRSTVT